MTPPVELLRFFLPALAIIVPGVWGWTLVFREQSARLRWALGSAAGLAAAVYLAFALSYIRVALFWPAWTIGAAVALVLWLRQRPRAPLFGRPKAEHVWIGLILLLVALSRLWVALEHYLPPGWDPAFHLLLAKKLALTGRMVDNWEPFEHIGLNYPLGSHLLVVNLGRLSGLALHTVFNLLIPVLGVFSTALIYALALEASKSERVAIYGAVAYGLWAVYGSIDYYRWGGLPNCLGMVFVLALLSLLAGDAWSRKHTAALSLLFTATFFTHHHVMLAAGAILAALFAYYLVFDRGAGKHIAIAKGLAGSALLGCFYIVPYALKARTIHNTGVFLYHEEFYDWHTLVARVGGVVLAFAAIGLAWYLFGRERWRGAPVLLVPAGALLALFVFFEYVRRYLVVRASGHDVVAFTPSRFLTDLVYLLCIFAGYGVAQIGRMLRAPMAAVVLAGVALAFTNRDLWLEMAHQRDLDPRLWQAYRWVEANTAADAMVLTSEPWAPYACWRRTLVTPIPISEPPLVVDRRQGPYSIAIRIDHEVHPGTSDRVLWGQYPWLIIEEGHAGATHNPR